MVLDGVSLYCMVLHGIVLYSILLHGNAKYFIALHGIYMVYKWYCISIDYIAWYIIVLMVLHDIYPCVAYLIFDLKIYERP